MSKKDNIDELCLDDESKNRDYVIRKMRRLGNVKH